MSMFQSRQGYWRYDFWFNKVRYQGSTRTKDLAEAKQIESEIRKSVRAGHFTFKPKPKGGKKGRTWKVGGAVSYFQYHNRVRVARGTPQKCDRCGTKDPEQYYDWANLTGRYEDINDYARMCRGCHRSFDQERRLKETAGAAACLLGFSA